MNGIMRIGEMGLLGLVILTAMLISLSGCICPITPGPDENTIVFSPPSELPSATVGEEYEYSFCEPDSAMSGAVCGGLTPATNPLGGKPPYSMIYGSGIHPTGINLALNGTLKGTPTIAGTYNFEVCARDGFGTEDCEYVSIDVEEQEIVETINVSPFYVLVRAPLCMNGPCKASTKVTVTSSSPWHVGLGTGSATTRCYDTVAEFSRYWSMCPSSGGAGTTEVELSTMVYGESTPDYMDELLVDRGSRWRIESVSDSSVYEELRVGIEYPYYK